MKKYSVILFLMVTLFTVVAQNNKIPTPRLLSKADLSNIVALNELVPDSMKEMNFVSVSLVFKKDNQEVIAESKSPLLSPEIRNLLRQAEPGKKIYFDTKYLDPTKADELYRVFTFVVKVTE